MGSMLHEDRAECFLVIEKLFNIFLFNTDDLPEPDNKGNFVLHKNIINLRNKTDVDNKIVNDDLVYIFLEKSIIEFLQKQTNNEDLALLLDCYYQSHANFIINKLIDIQRGSYNLILKYSPSGLTKEEITNLLFERNIVPVQIFTYLINLFGDFPAIFSNFENDKIPKESYTQLLWYYTLNSEIPHLYKKADMGLFESERFPIDLFTNHEQTLFQEWIKHKAQNKLYKIK